MVNASFYFFYNFCCRKIINLLIKSIIKSLYYCLGEKNVRFLEKIKFE